MILGDLLENYCWNDDLVNMARFFFSITILLTFPIECFVTREVLNTAVFPNFKATEESTEKRHYLTTTAILIVTYFFSMITDCLGIVLELNVSFFWKLLKEFLKSVSREFLLQFLWHTFYQDSVTSAWNHHDSFRDEKLQQSGLCCSDLPQQL